MSTKQERPLPLGRGHSCVWSTRRSRTLGRAGVCGRHGGLVLLADARHGSLRGPELGGQHVCRQVGDFMAHCYFLHGSFPVVVAADGQERVAAPRGGAARCVAGVDPCQQNLVRVLLDQRSRPDLTVFGGLYATRTDRTGWEWIRKRLSAGTEQRLLNVVLPAPRAWDNLFSERPNKYLLVRVEDDKWIAGRFAAASYAGGFPHSTDLYLKEAWEVDQDTGQLGANGLGFPVYVAADTIKWIEVLDEQGNGKEVDDGPVSAPRLSHTAKQAWRIQRQQAR